MVAFLHSYSTQNALRVAQDLRCIRNLTAVLQWYLHYGAQALRLPGEYLRSVNSPSCLLSFVDIALFQQSIVTIS